MPIQEEETEVVTPEEKEVEAPVETEETETETEEEDDSQETAEGEVEQEAKYDPNFKYKVRDKELEFDEFLRGSITSKEQEEKLRQLYTRSVGLDEVLASRQEISGKLEGLNAQLQKVAQFVDRDDFDSAFKRLGIDETKVMQWMAKKLQFEDLPEDQKRLYNEKRAADLALFEREERDQLRDQQLMGILAQNRSMELDFVLAKDGVSDVAKAFDERIGQPGAFRKEVENFGLFTFQTKGKDISAEEAAVEVANRYKALLGLSGAASSAGSAASATEKPVITTKPNHPTIPAVGKAGSPGKRPVQTMAELRKRAAEAVAAGG